MLFPIRCVPSNVIADPENKLLEGKDDKSFNEK